MDSERKEILINYYIHSINSAKKLGYYTIIYTNEVTIFKNIVDEIIELNSYEDSILWDCFKIKVLEERVDDFCLIDGDVILHSKLPDFNTDVVFDTYEVGNWQKEYKQIVNQLDNIGIKSIIEEWDACKKPVINCGLLYIKNKEHKNLYVDKWKLFNKFINDSWITYNIDTDYATMVGAQYLLTLIVNTHNLSVLKLNKYMGDFGQYHQHHFGGIKYKNPINNIESKNII
jgi:hypothetical protein